MEESSKVGGEVYTIEPSVAMPISGVKESTPSAAAVDDAHSSSGLCPVETTPVLSDPETRSLKQIKEVASSSGDLTTKSGPRESSSRQGSIISTRKILTKTTGNPQTGSSQQNLKQHHCCCETCYRPVRLGSTMKVVVTRILLTTFLAIYILVGTALFFCLESPMETLQQAEFTKWKNDTAILLAMELRQVKPYEEVWIRTVYHYLDSFERDVLQVCHQGYRRDDEKGGSIGKMWTLHSAFLFSVSILTTTGYVGATLRSPWARVALLVYSAFGIPMMVSWLAAIGTALASLWTWLYKRVCCAFYINRNRRIEPRHPTPQDTQYSAANQEYSEQLQANLATPLLPGNGNSGGRRSSASLENAAARPLIPEVSQQTEATQTTMEATRNTGVQTAREQTYSPAVEDFVLPTLLSLLIFVIYFIFGSAMVSVQEDWKLVDSVYFVYLHFTTLGVGSFQPTPISKVNNYGSPSTVKHDVLFVLYLIFGYCLLSMIVCLIFRYAWKKKRKRKSNANGSYCNGISASQIPSDAIRT